MPHKNKEDQLFSINIRKHVIKMKCHEYLGGKCKHCGENDYFKLCFHHLDPTQKEYNISYHFGDGFETLKPELDKCVLLCNNCHRELHFNENKELCDNAVERRKTKELFLQFINSFKCDICGYAKCIASLEFHHIDESSKEYSISKLISLHHQSLETLSDIIMTEINKCQVFCTNCHSKHHANTDFFNLHKEKIELNYKNYKPMVVKSDTSKVIELYNANKSIVQIAKELNCAPNTIGDKIKRLIKNGKLQKRDKTWVNQYG